MSIPHPIQLSGSLTRLQLIAKNWEQPSSFFQEKLNIKQKNLYRLRQDSKNKYPEILIKQNPIVAKKLKLI